MSSQKTVAPSAVYTLAQREYMLLKTRIERMEEDLVERFRWHQEAEFNLQQGKSQSEELKKWLDSHVPDENHFKQPSYWVEIQNSVAEAIDEEKKRDVS